MGRNEAHPRDARRSKRPRHPQSASRHSNQPSGGRGTTQEFYSFDQDEVFEDFSEYRGAAAEQDRHSRTAAWVEDFHDGWDSLGTFPGKVWTSHISFRCHGACTGLSAYSAAHAAGHRPSCTYSHMAQTLPLTLMPKMSSSVNSQLWIAGARSLLGSVAYQVLLLVAW